MRKYLDPMEPIFFTPPNQPTHPVGGRRLFKGGSGGGGERPATEQEMRLWSAQAKSLEQMNKVAMPNLVTGMNNLGELANESMDGTLATRLRDTASADAVQSGSMGLQAATRGLERYGSTMNPNAVAAQTNNAGIELAKAQTNATSMANVAAEDVKWQRNAALTGLASGQGAQSVSGMGSLTAQLTQNRSNQNSLDMQSQNNQAQAIGGLAIAGKMTGMYKDGGEVKAADGLRMYKPVTMPKVVPFNFQADTQEPKDEGGMMPTIVNTATSTIGTRMMANGLDKVGITAPKAAIDGLTTAAKDFITSPGVDATKAALGEASANYGAQATAAGEAGELALTEKAMEAKGMVDAGGATALAAEGAASGSSLMGAAGAAAPWLIGGYAIGSLLDLWADGGEVRKDMTAGGAVKGPGTETSDSIPALLSDGEVVVNAKAVDLPAEETKKVVAKWDGKNTSDLLMAINDRGLEKRYGKEGAKASPRYEGGAQKLASGGLAAIGRGIYTAAPMLNQIDQQREDKAYKQAQLGFQQSAENRTQGEFDRQQTEREQLQSLFGNAAKKFNELRMDHKAVKDGLMSTADFSKKYYPAYNSDVNDGTTMQPLANGNYAVTQGSGPKAIYKEFTPDQVFDHFNSPEMQMRVYEQVFQSAAAINPAYAQQAYGVLKDKLGEARAQRGEKRADNADQRAGEAHDFQYKDWNGIKGGITGANYDIHKKNLGIAQAGLGLRQQEFAAGEAGRKLNSAKSGLMLDVIDSAQTLADPVTGGAGGYNPAATEAAIAKKTKAGAALTALQQAMPENAAIATSEMKNARYLMQQGFAKDKALETAFGRKSASDQDEILSIAGRIASSGMVKPADAAKQAMEMHAAIKGGSATAAGGIASDPKAIAIRDDKTLSVDQKRAKLLELGYK